MMRAPRLLFRTRDTVVWDTPAAMPRPSSSGCALRGPRPRRGAHGFFCRLSSHRCLVPLQAGAGIPRPPNRRSAKSELQLVVRQLGLRLVHAGLGQLPEVQRRVDDEGELGLVLRDGRSAGCGGRRRDPVSSRYPSQGTAALQNALMDDLVAAGTDAIMISSVDPKTSTDAFNRIAAQIPLFTTDSDAPQSDRIAYIGSSTPPRASRRARSRSRAMPDGGTCMGFVGFLGADNTVERIEGFRNAVEGSGIELVDVRGDDVDFARARSNVDDVLVANPEVDCMVGFNSYNPRRSTRRCRPRADSARSRSSPSTRTRSRWAPCATGTSPEPSCSSRSSGATRPCT